MINFNIPAPARERLFGYQHAFEDPAVARLSLMIGGVLVFALAMIVVLWLSGRITADLRRELFKRYFAWVVMTPIVLLPILAGAAWTILLVTILSLMCYREFARATGLFREKVMSAIVVIGIIAINLTALDHWYGMFVALGPLTFAVMAAAAIFADRPKGYIQRVGLAAMAFLFFGVCLGHLSYFANDPNYRPMLLLLIVCVAMNDVFAFTVGKSIGGPKLVPNTSPNKTVSGSIGALLLTTTLFAWLGGTVFSGDPAGMTHRLLTLGLIVAAAGQLGDLTVSSIKRDVGIKDMGTIIPGHGGVLDRCNSLLLAAPAMFHFVGYLQGIGADGPVKVFTGR